MIYLATILSGCMAVPVMIAGSTLGNKTQTVVLNGPKFPNELFREAAIRSGGVVTANTNEYAKAEFPATAVKVELQLVKPGEYQLIGSSNAGSSMSLNLVNNTIVETTLKIADHIAAHDFKIQDNPVSLVGPVSSLNPAN
ncbi:MAG: hypothetical protein NT123_18475 [Proteobacteria bacterium]|nr:hypothetical protein [Pseudomonadota bacterium]